MKTCAEYRELSRIAAHNLDWNLAAEYLEMAVNVYPGKSKAMPGTLAHADITAMSRKACEYRDVALYEENARG